ncbi:MAG: hypothetical protein ACOC57_02475, partial [Acidobacteriota bacterium]
MVNFLKNRNKEEKRRRIFCFTLSIIIHILIIYSLILFFPPVKMIFYDKEIRKVVIAPPLTVPEVYDDFHQPELTISSLPLPRAKAYIPGSQIAGGGKLEKEALEQSAVSSHFPPLFKL